jgi:hypothetical protein
VAVTANYGIVNPVFVSPDGTNWTQSSVGTEDSLYAVTSGNYQYIAVGDGGAIMGSLLAAIPPGGSSYQNGAFTLTAMGPPGTTYGVYVSHDLINWTWLQNVTFPANSTYPFTDPNAGNYTGGYYELGPPGP